MKTTSDYVIGLSLNLVVTIRNGIFDFFYRLGGCKKPQQCIMGNAVLYMSFRVQNQQVDLIECIKFTSLPFYFNFLDLTRTY